MEISRWRSNPCATGKACAGTGNPCGGSTEVPYIHAVPRVYGTCVPVGSEFRLILANVSRARGKARALTTDRGVGASSTGLDAQHRLDAKRWSPRLGLRVVRLKSIRSACSSGSSGSRRCATAVLQEHGADRHAVRTVEPVVGKAATDGSARMSASAGRAKRLRAAPQRRTAATR